VTEKIGSYPVHAVKSERQKPKHGNRKDQGWLETEGTEGSQLKQGDLFVESRVYGVLQSDKPARAGVRASIVAVKPGNSGGAKGRRKVNAE
jgi:hypothetical protein